MSVTAVEKGFNFVDQKGEEVVQRKLPPPLSLSKYLSEFCLSDKTERDPGDETKPISASENLIQENIKVTTCIERCLKSLKSLQKKSS